MTIDEIIDRAIPLGEIECPTKKAAAVIRRRQLRRDIEAYSSQVAISGKDIAITSTTKAGTVVIQDATNADSTFYK